MNNMIVDAINRLRPAAEWTIDERGLTWLDKVQSQPTEEEIQAEIDNPSPVVPESVPMAKARAALIRAGLDDDVEALFDSIPDPIQKKLAKNEWEYETTVSKNNPLFKMVVAGLQLTPQRVDELLIDAENG
ncbi:MAG: hypothetical protein HGB35_01965 [Geobacteraceae bacterium]|nr:hypothetical protein [Geobacteraceae bacterium]